jgi:death-on-curing protein
MTFGEEELYATLAEKASTLAFSLVQNHPFVDGNKRVGHAAMEVFLLLNGYELAADVDEQERLILELAAGHVVREDLTRWVETHLVSYRGEQEV